MTTTLPDLTGSAKQVPWAKDIRRDTIQVAEELKAKLTRAAANKPGQDHLRDAACAAIDTYIKNIVTSHTSAKWWIDNRFDAPSGVKNAAREAAHAAVGAKE